MKSYQEYSGKYYEGLVTFEELNEGWAAKTVGAILLGLLTILPTASKAQDMLDYNNPIGLTNPLSPLNPIGYTNPASPLYMFGDNDNISKEDPFKESIVKAYNIVRTLKKKDIVEDDHRVSSVLDSLDMLYNTYEDFNSDDLDNSIVKLQTAIKNTNKPLREFLDYYGHNYSDSTRQVLKRVAEFDYGKDKDQLAKDYEVLYGELETMRKDKDISNWSIKTGGEKALWIILIGLGAAVLGLLIWMFIDINRY